MCGGSAGSPAPMPMYEPEPEIVQTKAKKNKARTGKKRQTLLTGSQGLEDNATIGAQTLLGG